MATFTTNYNLRKPEDPDDVDVTTDLGNNLDTIDEVMKANEDDIASGLAPLSGFKSADTTRTNTVTLAVDNDFTVPVESGVTYALEMFLEVLISKASGGAGPATNGFQYQFQIPGNSKLRALTTRRISDNAQPAESVQSVVDETAVSDSPTFTAGPVADSRFLYKITGFVKPAASGDLEFWWAQATLAADGTELKEGSWIKLNKLA